MRTTLLLLIAFLIQTITFTQPVPKQKENVTFLVTFGKRVPDKCENDARELHPIVNCKSSILQGTQASAADPDSDNTWIAFGPFNVAYGSFTRKYGGRVYKNELSGCEGTRPRSLPFITIPIGGSLPGISKCASGSGGQEIA